MSKITICPHFLIDYSLTTPDEILRDIIQPLSKCLDECNKEGIQVVLSKEILTAFTHSYPWHQAEDPEWSGHLRDWHNSITPSLLRATIIKVDSTSVSVTSNCSILQSTTAEMFSRFLNVFGTKTMHGDNNEEGIFVSEICSYPSQLESFLYIFEMADLIKIKYPWMRVYNQPQLPLGGEFPFVPPENWRKFSNPIKITIRDKGSISGFRDQSGNSWEWDKLHNNHWDVQHSNARKDYTNVSPEGKRITDKQKKK